MKKQQKGVTIFEILISVAIGLLVISGVVRLLSHTSSHQKLLSTDAEIKETLSYVDNRLSFIFKEALSSPCGSIDSMLSGSDSTPSYLKVAKIGSSTPQKIPNVLLQPASKKSITVERDQFPMVMPGIAGNSKELKDEAGKPFSESLPGIIAGTEYVIVMEISEKIIINSTEIGFLEGGRNIGGILKKTNQEAIPTSEIVTGLKSSNTPFIITDCKQADIFMPSDKVKKNSIPIAENLAFNTLYRPAEAILSPVKFYAYYTATVDGMPQFTRTDLITGNRQSLVAGVTNIQYEWGLGEPDNARVQGYFTTAQVLSSGLGVSNFRENIISVKATIEAEGSNSKYQTRNVNSAGKFESNNLSRSAVHTYTIRNKMQRI